MLPNKDKAKITAIDFKASLSSLRPTSKDCKVGSRLFELRLSESRIVMAARQSLLSRDQGVDIQHMASARGFRAEVKLVFRGNAACDGTACMNENARIR